MKIRELKVHADQEQICRTCEHQGDRLWDVSLTDILDHENKGGATEELKCHPDELRALERVTIDGLRPGATPGAPGTLIETCGQRVLSKCFGCARFRSEVVLVPAGTNSNGKTWFRQVTVGGHCSIPAEGIIKDGEVVFCDRINRAVDVAEAEAQQNCARCGFLAFTTDDNTYEHVSPVLSDLTPAEMAKVREDAPEDKVGLRIWQERERLGKVPAPKGADPSLGWSWCAPGISLFFEADVVNTTTTRTETVIREAEFEVVPRCESIPERPEAAWSVWGQYVFENYGEFLCRFVPRTHTLVTGLEKKLICPPVYGVGAEVITEMTVRFRGAGTIATLAMASTDDTTGIIWRTANPNRVAIEITSPHHRRYNLRDRDTVQTRCLPTIECPVCHGAATEVGTLWNSLGCARCAVLTDKGPVSTGKIYDLGQRIEHKPSLDHLVRANCPYCVDSRPCYWHAKAPMVHEIVGEFATSVSYGRPHGNAVPSKTTTGLCVSASGDVTTRGEGTEPNPALFRVQLRSLMANHPRHARAILRQFARQRNQLPRGRTWVINLGFGKFSSAEPGKPFCSLHAMDPSRGLDLREILGDRFGDPRSVQGTNPTNDAELDRDRRAGDSYFSWIKHSELLDWQIATDLSQRIAEEMVASELQAENQRAANYRAFVMPEKPTVLALPMHVNERDESAQIWSPRQYQDWLDEQVKIPIDDEGNTKIVSRRWQIYEYEQYRPTSLKAARDMPEMVAFKPHLRSEIDPNDEPPTVGFWCTRPSCGTYYAVDEINDPADPTCDHLLEGDVTCGAPLEFFEKDAEHSQGHMRQPWEREGGPIGYYLSSRWWLQQGLLYRVGCASYTPRRKQRYDRVPGPPSSGASAPGDLSLLMGKRLGVEIEGEKLSFVLGTDISMDAPLVRGFVDWTGENKEFSYIGGHGDTLTAKVLSIE